MRQFFLVFATGYSHCSKAKLVRKLNTKMTQTTDTLHCDEIPRLGNAVPQGIEGGGARAKQRSGLGRVEFIWHKSQGLLRGNHIFSVASIIGKPRNLLILAVDEVSPAAGRTHETMPSVPTHANTLPNLPGVYSSSNGIYLSHDFVARDARIVNGKKSSLF